MKALVNTPRQLINFWVAEGWIEPVPETASVSGSLVAYRLTDKGVAASSCLPDEKATVPDPTRRKKDLKNKRRKPSGRVKTRWNGTKRRWVVMTDATSRIRLAMALGWTAVREETRGSEEGGHYLVLRGLMPGQTEEWTRCEIPQWTRDPRAATGLIGFVLARIEQETGRSALAELIVHPIPVGLRVGFNFHIAGQTLGIKFIETTNGLPLPQAIARAISEAALQALEEK